jgi:hypothetical protein
MKSNWMSFSAGLRGGPRLPQQRMTQEELHAAYKQEREDFLAGRKKLEQLTGGGLEEVKNGYRQLIGQLFAMRHKDGRYDVVREVIRKIREFISRIDAMQGL